MRSRPSRLYHSYLDKLFDAIERQPRRDFNFENMKGERGHAFKNENLAHSRRTMRSLFASTASKVSTKSVTRDQAWVQLLKSAARRSKMR